MSVQIDTRTTSYTGDPVFPERRYVEIPADAPPALAVVIDTEEEFDWNAPPDRAATAVTAMASIGRAQQVFDAYGLKPCYVIDYPVATQDAGSELLQEFCESGRCEIGAHLHPWVNPPFAEEVSVYNMFPGNLDRAIEREKLMLLRDVIEERFGRAPQAYKAGRYGLGPHTELSLKDLGFKIDLSFSPPVDHRRSGGPDYSCDTALPFWFGPDSSLLEIPMSGAFVGLAQRSGRSIHAAASRLEVLKLPGILSRLRIIDRLILSPEGFSLEELKQLTRHLYAMGHRLFCLAFHSPTLKPGCTEYVQNDSDLKLFLSSLREYFEFFFNELNGVPTTPSESYTRLEQMK